MILSVHYRNMACRVLLICVCLFPLASAAQSIDALHQHYRPLVAASKPDTSRVRILQAYGNDMIDHNGDTALAILLEASRLATLYKDKLGLGRSALSIGIVYADKGDYVMAMNWYQKAAAHFSNPVNHLFAGKTFNNIGNLYYFRNQLDEALKWYFKACESFQQAKEALLLANVYDAIGNVFNQTGQYNRSLEYLTRAEEMAARSKDTISLLRILNNKSVTINSMGNTRESIQLKLRALKMADDHQVLTSRYMIRSNIADCYIDLDLSDSAFHYLHTAEQLAEQANAPFYLTKIYLCYAKAYGKINNYRQAEKYLHKTVNIATSIGSRVDLLKAYGDLIKVSSHLNMNQQIRESFEKFLLYNDSVTNEDMRNTVNELEVKYRTLQKDKEIADKQIAIEQHKLALKKKNMVIWISAIAFAALAIIVSLVFRTHRQKQLLQQQQIRMLQKEQELLSARAIMEGEERERARIARNLHDGAGSFLSAAGLYLNSLGQQIRQLPGHPAFRESLSLLNEASAEIRETAHNLMPVLLTEKGLFHALKNFCEKIGNNKQLQIDFQCYGKPLRFNRNFELMVYRTVQELLNNVVKHAEATVAIVQLSFSDTSFSVSVEDNGKGFNPEEEQQRQSGLGISGLTNRMQAFNGKVDISSSEEGSYINILFDIETLEMA
jgi:two-component system NarL family sensor kinase